VFRKVAKKAYHLLAGKRTDSALAAWKQIDELAKKSAPTMRGVRNDHPPLPQRLQQIPMAIKINENETLAQLYNGKKIYVDARDISLAPHIMIEGLWEAHVTRVIEQLLQEDDIFFDIGANFAYYCCVAAPRLKNQLGRFNIHAFEANPDLIPLVTKTFDINGLRDSAVINNIAVSDKIGELTLHRDENLWGSASLRKEVARAKKETTYKVKTTSIDQYCNEHNIDRVDVIKLDIEGYEDRAYAGMKQTIQKNPQLRIVMEFTFDIYTNEQAFFEQLKKDFSYMYFIDARGEYEFINEYKTLRNKTHNELAMVVLSNKELS